MPSASYCAALAAWLTDDTVVEDTSRAPDGRRIEGKPAVVVDLLSLSVLMFLDRVVLPA